MDERQIIKTSDMNCAAWLMANDVPFLRAEAGPRVQFVFDDQAGVADRMLGEFVRDERLQRFIAARGRCRYILRTLQDGGRPSLGADEVVFRRR